MTKIRNFWPFLVFGCLFLIFGVVASSLTIKYTVMLSKKNCIFLFRLVFMIWLTGTLLLCIATNFLTKYFSKGRIIEFQDLMENKPFIAINQVSNHIWTIHKVSRRTINQTDYYVQLPRDEGCTLKHGDDLIKKHGQLFKLSRITSTDNQPILPLYGNYYKGQVIYGPLKKPKTS